MMEEVVLHMKMMDNKREELHIRNLDSSRKFALSMSTLATMLDYMSRMNVVLNNEMMSFFENLIVMRSKHENVVKTIGMILWMLWGLEFENVQLDYLVMFLVLLFHVYKLDVECHHHCHCQWIVYV